MASGCIVSDRLRCDRALAASPAEFRARGSDERFRRRTIAGMAGLSRAARAHGAHRSDYQFVVWIAGLLARTAVRVWFISHQRLDRPTRTQYGKRGSNRTGPLGERGAILRHLEFRNLAHGQLVCPHARWPAHLLHCGDSVLRLDPSRRLHLRRGAIRPACLVKPRRLHTRARSRSAPIRITNRAPRRFRATDQDLSPAQTLKQREAFPRRARKQALPHGRASECSKPFSRGWGSCLGAAPARKRCANLRNFEASAGVRY